MGKETPVDGAKIAAEILKRLPAKDQKRLVGAIQERAPEAAALIDQNMYPIEDLLEINQKGLQILVKEVDHKDLVLSLKTMPDNVKQVLFGSMAQGRKKMVEDDFFALPKVAVSEVEAAQKRILDKMEELRKSGIIHAMDKKDIYA